MRLEKFLSPSRIVDIKSRDFKSALLELLALCPEINVDESSTEDEDNVLNQLLKRERVIPTDLPSTVALPHVSVPLKSRKYVLAVGRCPSGLENADDSDDKKIRVLFLVLASEREREKTYFSVLTALSTVLEETEFVSRLEVAPDLKTFRDLILERFRGTGTPEPPVSRQNLLMLREAEKIASGAKCSKILLFADTFKTPTRSAAALVAGVNKPLVLVSENALGFDGFAGAKTPPVITVSALNSNRFAQFRSALFVGMTRGILRPDECVCCIGGRPGSDLLDTIMSVDLRTEFPSFLAQRGAEMLPAGVKPEVLERALAIATRLAIEGHEGLPAGCILVIGDRNLIAPHTKPLILNPFRGHPESDRNILNPFAEETVKELAWIDGAIIINGDGVAESAGTMLTSQEQAAASILASGLGTRHAAASSITVAADCVAFVVSASTRQVTLFHHGEPLVVFDRFVSA
ncbi:MAG: diadenylate cyclase [Puniceicoccales bacterium]|jgi:DNA integrity scanning protein DisA with diadenylate cyclase activity/mannitol/fructose-specific phosphotransferase system IIA component (Ntr-type)|nr:diadenylate cyclase [Puniceicoccales bacterium]